jgi:hypothetical protein
MGSIDYSTPTKNGADKWKYRRLFMLWQMIFCKVVVVYVLLKGLETKVALAALDFSFMLMGTIILAYVFGATLEDISKLKRK